MSLVSALILVIGITSILQAFSSVPIAIVYCIFFLGPLISYILAVIFLSEAVSPLRTALVVGCFVGVIIVAQPTKSMEPNLYFATLARLFIEFF
jgi:drug/metabolite transporter (DMT)-like permease